jgi:hypothetical protein
MSTSLSQMPHPLFHQAVALPLAFSPGHSWDALRRSAAVVLALAVALRGLVTFRQLCPPVPPQEAAATTLALALAMALPKWWDFPSVYLGQVNPNVWHNPTAVFASPLALLTFLAAARYREAPAPGRALSVGAWSALCAVAKPNYLLAFLPCFGPVLLALLYRAVRRGSLSAAKAVWHLLAALGPPAVTLAWQYWVAFGREGRAGITFDPLGVWSQFTPFIATSALAGLAFPCVVVAFFGRHALADWRLLFAWAVLAVAIAQYALLAETGPRATDGNFYWAVVPATYVLFLESSRLTTVQPTGFRRRAAFLALALHAASGATHLVRSVAHPVHAVNF